MAITVPLSREILHAIAAQLGTVAPAAGTRLEELDRPEIGESAQVWVLPTDAVIARSPLTMASPNGRWHHQIYRRGKPELYAYTRVLGPRPSDWQVTAIFESEAAGDIDAAIKTADESVPGRDEARLLVIPAYHVQCLWIVAKEHLLIPAVVPAGYRAAISRWRLYRAGEFFDTLKEVPLVRGARF